MALVFAGNTQTVTVTRNPAHESTFDYEALNHISKRLSGGNQYTLHMGPTLLKGRLVLNYVAGDEARDLMKLFVNDCRFTLFPFTITPPDCVNLGLGYGEAITCRLNNVRDTSTMFVKVNVVDRYTVTIPYEFVVEDEQVGLGVVN